MGIALSRRAAVHPARTWRSTSYTVLAVERDGSPIVLHTQRANALVRQLLDAGCIEPLRDTRVVRSEVTVANSRFDFLLDQRSTGNLFLEVKSTTLYGNGVAMFPDAVTERGRKHLNGLIELQQTGVNAAVLFLVHAPGVRWFMPDFHTDLAFSQTLMRAHDNGVRILPAAVEWDQGLCLAKPVRILEIPWAHVRREAHDRGGYLLIMRLSRDRRLRVGGLESRLFPKGYYVYVGSAMANLCARLARHQRQRKRLHWHIDYLRAAAAEVIAVPIRSSVRIECELGRALESVSTIACSGFGSSDCGCASHLFSMPGNPLHDGRFHHVLQRFRMRHPDPAAAVDSP